MIQVEERLLSLPEKLAAWFHPRLNRLAIQVNVYWPMFPPISLVDAHPFSEYIGIAAKMDRAVHGVQPGHSVFRKEKLR